MATSQHITVPGSRHLAALVVMPALLLGCQGGDDPAPSQVTASTIERSPAPPAQAPVTGSGPAEISFANLLHDFGTMYETEEESVKFTFTNAGGERLVIRDVKTSCGCTAATPDKREYLPGESGSIHVTFDPTGPGATSKYVTVVTNAQPQPTTRLTIKADVKAFLVFEPKWLKLGVLPYRREHRANMTISSPDPDFVIESVRTTHAHATARVLPSAQVSSDPDVGGPANAKVVEVIIPADAPWGGCYFALDVTARGRPFPGADPVTHTSSVRVAGQLFGELSAEGDMFRFGVDPGQAIDRTITLTGRGGRPFDVLSATVADPQLPDANVRVQKIAPDTWQLTLTATAPPRPARCLGKVTVKTNVPGEDSIEIGILGVVRTRSPAADVAAVRHHNPPR